MTQLIVTGVLTLLGVVIGLVGARWVQTLGGVRCEISWYAAASEGSVDSPGGVRVTARQLNATFLNCKAVPITVWDMRVVFYRDGQPLGDEERPHIASTRGRPVEPVNLPPRIPVTEGITVTPERDQPDKQRAVEEADRVEFVAIINGGNDVRRELAHWGQINGAAVPQAPKPCPQWRFWR